MGIKHCRAEEIANEWFRRFTSSALERTYGLHGVSDVASIRTVHHRVRWSLSLCIALLVAWPGIALAQVPGPADISRIKRDDKIAPLERAPGQELVVPSAPPYLMQIPEGAKEIKLNLSGVQFEGMTVFTPEAVKDIYAAYQGMDVTLEVAWLIAAQLKQRYQEAGYFLSDVFVPEQRIRDGLITIRVVEGYIGQVELNDPIAGEPIVKALIQGLTAQRPVTSEALESFLLRMNDLPGVVFRAVMSPPEEQQAGGVKITLMPAKEEGRGAISFDNYGSRFLGPHEITFIYDMNIVPLQQTVAALSSALPFEELYFASLKHAIPLTPSLSVELTGSASKAYPGHTIKALDVEARSFSGGAAFCYKPVRQRQENLTLRLGVDAIHTHSDTLSVPLVRESTRALRAGIAYDGVDAWRGQNIVEVSVSHGLEIFNASETGELNLSRAQAAPNYTKANLLYTRMQHISSDWMAIAVLSGQLSSDPLYTSEEFGYGGQTFGRAYDNSEIIGDNGVMGSFELRYGGISMGDPISATPYAFYDIGKVWSEGTGQPSASGSSAGAGLRFAGSHLIQGNLGIAFPLTKPANDPIYGVSDKGPRVLLQLSKGF